MNNKKLINYLKEFTMKTKIYVIISILIASCKTNEFADAEKLQMEKIVSDQLYINYKGNVDMHLKNSISNVYDLESIFQYIDTHEIEDICENIELLKFKGGREYRDHTCSLFYTQDLLFKKFPEVRSYSNAQWDKITKISDEKSSESTTDRITKSFLENRKSHTNNQNK